MAYESILRAMFSDAHNPQVASFVQRNDAFAHIRLVDVVEFCIRMGWADTAYIYARMLARTSTRTSYRPVPRHYYRVPATSRMAVDLR